MPSALSWETVHEPSPASPLQTRLQPLLPSPGLHTNISLFVYLIIIFSFFQALKHAIKNSKWTPQPLPVTVVFLPSPSQQKSLKSWLYFLPSHSHFSPLRSGFCLLLSNGNQMEIRKGMEMEILIWKNQHFPLFPTPIVYDQS